MDRRDSYATTGRIITETPWDFPMPKWVNYRPIKHGIRYNLEGMKYGRLDLKENFKRNKR